MVIPEPVRVGGRLGACCVTALFRRRRKAWTPAKSGDTASCPSCGQAMEYVELAWQAVARSGDSAAAARADLKCG